MTAVFGCAVGHIMRNCFGREVQWILWSVYTVKFGVFPEHPFLEATFWGVGEHPLGRSVSTLGVLISKIIIFIAFKQPNHKNFHGLVPMLQIW